MRKFAAITLSAIIGLSALTGCSGQAVNEADALEEKYTPVEVAVLAPKTITTDAILSGKIFADKEVSVVTKTPGKVAALNVAVGSVVQTGSVLFRIDGEDLQRQAEIMKRNIDLAQASYDISKENNDHAKVTLARTQALYDQGAVPKSQLEQAQLAASDTGLRTLQVQIEQARSQYAQAVAGVSDLTVTAPVSGIVSAVNAVVGEMASSALPSVVIVDVNRVYAEINVAENAINALQLGMAVSVDIPSVSQEPFIGKIDSISPAADSKTLLYPVRIYIDNPGHLIKPGMFAKIKLATTTRENVIAVPTEAIIDENGKSLVYVVEKDRAKAKEVQLGLDTGIETEILSGLASGETVILKGQNYVKNDSLIKIVKGE